MSTDPLKLTREDIEALVTYHVKNSQNYAAGLKQVKLRSKAENGAPKPSLGDLDIVL